MKDHTNAGDTWEVRFTANGILSLMTMTVKEVGVSKEVEGKTYHDVTMIEAESKFSMNGTIISTNFFSQYYYAMGIGLILTTTSNGDSHSLVDYVLY